jgi:hypothetical protein
MGSSSRSSNRTSTTTNTTTIDERVAADQGAIVTRGNVTVTDSGAIALAGEVSEQAINFGGDLARESLASTTETLAQIINADRAEETQLADQLIRIGIPALVVMVIAWRVWR